MTNQSADEAYIRSPPGEASRPSQGWPSAGRTKAADTHDWDMSTSDPVPVE
jgi:hypothetical protein